MLIVFLISEPWWNSVYPFNLYATLSRQYFLRLDLNNYIRYQQKLLTDNFSIPAKNIIAASVINNQLEMAKRYLLLCQSKKKHISSLFIKEIEMLDAVNRKQLPLRVWLSYLKSPRKHGYLAYTYLAYLEAVKVDLTYAIPVPPEAAKIFKEYEQL